MEAQEIRRLDTAWAADSTSIGPDREFVPVAVITDVFRRGIRGWYPDRDLSSELTHPALSDHGPPQIHPGDHDVQYLANGYVEKLHSRGIAVGWSAKGKPMGNGKCERFIRTLKESEVVVREYADLAYARRQTQRFLEDVYMRRRNHSALDDVTPAEFQATCRTRANTNAKGG